MPTPMAPIDTAGAVLRGAAARRAVQPWRLDELDREPAAPLPLPPDPAPAPEAAAPADLDALRAGWEAAWQARYDEAVEAARAEGHAAGYAEARAELEAEAEAARAELAADAERLRGMWRDYVKKAEPLLASLAFDVAQSLLSAPLPPDVRSVSAQALAQALDELAGSPVLDVSLHPDDLARLEAFGLTDDLQDQHEALRWKADPALEPGDWIVQSPEAAIRRLRDEVLDHLRRRLDLVALARKSREEGRGKREGGHAP